MNKILVILSILFSFTSYSNSVNNTSTTRMYLVLVDDSLTILDDTNTVIIDENGDPIVFKKRKFTAIALALLTGPIGGHRLYLGTKPIVPVVYAVTLGGGFLIIPIMDIITIIFTKDLSKFENNDQILMWINGDNNEDDFFEYDE